MPVAISGTMKVDVGSSYPCSAAEAKGPIVHRLTRERELGLVIHIILSICPKVVRRGGDSGEPSHVSSLHAVASYCGRRDPEIWIVRLN